MGYTSHTKQIAEKLILDYKVTRALDLGAQNDYTYPLPAPYTKEWYQLKGIEYYAIDLNQENGALAIDLKEPLSKQDADYLGVFDLVVDAGTSEHVSDGTGKHDISAYYNCWKTKYDLLKDGGVMLNENPKSGNWPGHGCNYVTIEFYNKLAAATGCKILQLEENAAMGNITDGWNITCVLQKIMGKPFISLEKFKKLGVLMK